MNNRPIKFRAWDKQEKKMWYDVQNAYDNVEGIPVDNFGEVFRREMVDRKKKRFIVMQYTGLKDKSGEEIYEGDIVGVKGKEEGTSLIQDLDFTELVKDIRFCFGAWGIANAQGGGAILEVIGNKYQGIKDN